MQRRLRQVFTSVREHSCVLCAKITSMGGFCDLHLIIVKATCPDDLPLRDKYVYELLKIFSISTSSFRAFLHSFTRRFGNTRCWRVALKCLVLLHRLLRSLPDNSPFRLELLRARSNGLLSLYPCHFRDRSSSNSGDYTIFIRSYAHLLDEALGCLSIDSKEKGEEEVPESLPDKMKEVGPMLEVLPQLQSLIDRVMDCRPTGAAARSFVARSAMKYIIRDSFTCYTAFRKEIVVVLDNLFQLPYRSCVAAFSIYKKEALQANQLCEFYDWCRSMGLCGPYEYPFVDRIPQIQVQALETFVNGMWQLTDTSSSTASPLTSMESPLSLTEDDSGKQLVVSDIIASNNWAKFEENVISKKMVKDEEEEPLIQLEDSDDGSWEALLEASISQSCVTSKNFFFHRYCYGYGYGYESSMVEGQQNEANGWQMQIYNPYPLNPFYLSQNMAHYSGSFASNPTYPWGL